MDTHQMLADRNTYPDSYVIKTPEGDVTLGQFREAFYARERALANSERELQEGAAAIAKGRVEVTDLFQVLMADREKLAEQRGELERMRANTTANWNGEATAYDQRLAAFDAAIKATNDNIEKLARQVQGASEQFVYDRFRDDFRGEELPAGMSEKDVIKWAQEHNVKRGYLPDVKGALRELRKPQEWEARVKQAEKDGYERAQKELTLRTMNGNSRTLLPSETPAGSQIKITPNMDSNDIISAAVDAAANDADVRSHMAGLVPAPGM